MKLKVPRAPNSESYARPVGPRPTFKLVFTASIAIWCGAAIVCSAAEASDSSYLSRTAFGEVGILDMPSARFAPDGQLSVTAATLAKTQRVNFGFQFLPWLEGSFRYSRIPQYLGVKGLHDRSFGLKLRLFRETPSTPEVALGVRDLLGSGVYSAEYLAASKRLGDFDVTAGLGWGRLAQNNALPNPFGLVFSSFKTRADVTPGTGSGVNFGQYFHGPKMGIFGGVIWQSPLSNLNLLVEYSSDRYRNEVLSGDLKVRSPFNIGATYRLLNGVTVSAGWFYGSTYGVTLSASADPTVPVFDPKSGPQVPKPAIRTAQEQLRALGMLVERNGRSNVLSSNSPWVEVPQEAPDQDSLALASVLMSTQADVHDVDVQGDTLLVDARFVQTAGRQCDRYATTVSALVTHLHNVAVSDLRDPSGQVAICAIPRESQLLVTDGALSIDGLDPRISERRIRTDVEAQSIEIEALGVETDAIWLYFSDSGYSSVSEAAGRIARVLMKDAPPGVEVFHLIAVRNGIAQREILIVRSALERATLAYGTPGELTGGVSVNSAPRDNPLLDRAFADSYPRFHWNVSPGVRQGFYDPRRSLQIGLFGAVNFALDATPNVTIEGRGEANIANTFSFNASSMGQLPHVRSDIEKYLQHGINGIAKLDALYRTRIDVDTYVEVKAGYLEDMFAGAGAQLLWRPDDSRFSVGADLYEVWQRDFDRLLGVRNYHVVTGHASLYYESPWYGVNFALHTGRYLAGDYGATIEVSRRFATGIEVGAFATFTNVPFSKFGEGSFDKGVFVHIPLEWALPFHSRTAYDLLLRSLARDGGQRLQADDSLFEDTRAASYGEVFEHAREITTP